MAELKLLGSLAEIVGSRRMEVHLERPVKLREVLGKEIPENHAIILVNRKTASLDSLIHDEDRVLIMPIISGG
jgi:molybdopterin converting factor small subunit